MNDASARRELACPALVRADPTASKEEFTSVRDGDGIAGLVAGRTGYAVCRASTAAADAAEWSNE
jgi:hypothetical protein